MSTNTLIILLAIAVLVLAAIVMFLLWHAYRQERHLKSKNEAIVREMKRCDQVIERAVKHGVSRAALLSAVLLLSVTGYAQSECFEYEDTYDKTIINGLTDTGKAKTSLEIPAAVTAVRGGAFTMATSSLAELYIENGGNPAFESGLFGENTNTLTKIDMGDGMSVANMIALLQSVGTFNTGTEISASGFSGEKDISDATWNAVTWTNVSSITLPAELIGEQTFGNATVYGRFNIAKEIISFCTSATFQDTDNGSNMLFYRADAIAADGRLHIQRVDYVVAGEGVLIHRTANSQGYCDLPRYSESASYASNLLKGVTTATTISATDGDKTNYVLKNGAFHPTTGGTIKANKAYLQIPTAAAREGVLTIDFDEEGTSLTPTLPTSLKLEGSNYYDLQGRRVASAEANSSLFTLHSSLKKGFYINNGKKYVIR